MDPQVHATLRKIGFGNARRLAFTYDNPIPSGQEGRAIAHAMAKQVREKLKELYHTPEVKQIHLFLAMPTDLAVLIGYELNAVGRLTVYEQDKVGEAYYVAYTLPK